MNPANQLNRDVRVALHHSDPTYNALHARFETDKIASEATQDIGVSFECPPGYQLTDEARRRMQMIANAPGKAAQRRLEQRFAQDPCRVFEAFVAP